ncbi:DUF1186 domain-containing protein [Leptothoe spongobia]|uniref:DUF1186 domain-containing protein n=1 Tax=Leptothoe spongobia TAU-MAC 1115 TaxID=1967444 RepID=A0A947GKK1_9CYAN|nr:DUF1186 domain-containing protein [Leptothoe spongobia]MBT9316873.1 DUF1186 domain-containing protein [Leptothoe spongobia TAU-MAC 1115]
MDIAAIMEALKESHDSQLPRKILKQAIVQQEDITPLLIAEFIPAAEKLAEIDANPDYIRHLYALYLLAQFREPQAYQPIIDFVSVPGDIIMDVTGDIVTEDLANILASVCDRNLVPIKQTIENTDVNEYVRSASMRALLILVVEGEISRESVLDYFEEIWPTFRQETDDDDDFIYHSLLMYSLDLCPHESLIEVIRQDYESKRISPDWITIQDLDKAINLGPEGSIQRLSGRRNYFITDIIKSIGWWGCFHSSAPKQKRPLPVGMVQLSGFAELKKTDAKRKKKRQAQKQSRKQNRSKKKR